MKVHELINELLKYPAGKEILVNPQSTEQNFRPSHTQWDGDEDTPVWIFIERAKDTE